MKSHELGSEIQVAVSETGALICRNNSGLARYKKNGEEWVVPYGVGPNGGGGGDWICCIPVVITSDMVGQTIGVFGSIEQKIDDDKRHAGQKKWHAWVKMRGGRSGIARTVKDALDIIMGVSDGAPK